MTSSDKDTTALINHLVETCKDGEEGFKTAAGAVKDAQLKQLFTSYAQQRARFAEDLQLAVRRLGGDPGKRGSIAGALHRSWMSVKSAVVGSSDGAIVREAERGEDGAVQAFEKVLAEELPVDVQALVERQLIQVREAHDRISTLQRQLEPARE